MTLPRLLLAHRQYICMPPHTFSRKRCFPSQNKPVLPTSYRSKYGPGVLPCHVVDCLEGRWRTAQGQTQKKKKTKKKTRVNKMKDGQKKKKTKHNSQVLVIKTKPKIESKGHFFISKEPPLT